MDTHRVHTVLDRALMRLGAGALAAITALAFFAAPLTAGTTSKSADESGNQTEEYWTPERMKNAKPAPMPHPDASKGVTVAPRPSEDVEEGATGSEPGK
jgi:hypothetical protein